MSSYSTNSMAIVFPSVPSMKDEPMVEMFKILETTGLKSFLWCTNSIFEPILDQFFNTTSMENGAILCTVQGHKFKISQRIFADVFDLLRVGVASCKDLPPTNDKTWRPRLSHSWNPLSSPNCSKKDLKVEFRLFVDLINKCILAKAGVFEKTTIEKFQMMATIASGIQINWFEIIFKILTDMVKKNGQY